MTSQIKQDAEWMQILRADVKATGSVTKTAKRVGVSRPTISLILNGSGPYGKGRASTAHVAEKVMHTIGMVACPFLTEYHSAEHRITGLQCREFAYRENPPTNSPREMQHWRACQTCDKRVKQAVVIVKKAEKKPAPSAPKKVGRTAIIEVQQAGVIDTITLPLPEVGAPQIQLTEEVV